MRRHCCVRVRLRLPIELGSKLATRSIARCSTHCGLTLMEAKSDVGCSATTSLISRLHQPDSEPMAVLVKTFCLEIYLDLCIFQHPSPIAVHFLQLAGRPHCSIMRTAGASFACFSALRSQLSD